MTPEFPVAVALAVVLVLTGDGWGDDSDEEPADGFVPLVIPLTVGVGSGAVLTGVTGGIEIVAGASLNGAMTHRDMSWLSMYLPPCLVGVRESM